MGRVKQQSYLVRCILTVAVVSMIALLLVFSFAISAGVGHGFDQITLALPIFFVFLFLAAPIGDWLQVEDLLIQPTTLLSTFLARAPPA
jgi:hypothetical protein